MSTGLVGGWKSTIRTPVAARKSIDWGKIRHLESAKWQASFIGPDKVRHFAPSTFIAKDDARAWLAEWKTKSKGADVKTWKSPRQELDELLARRSKPDEQLTLADYVPRFLKHRHVKGRPLSPVTRDNYDTIARLWILPQLGDLPLEEISRRDVDNWHDSLPEDRPTSRARAYQTLRTILNDAIERDEIAGPNPCRIRGGGRVERATKTTIATAAEVEAATAAMPEYRRLMIPLAAYCALRLGEVTALRRGDVDTTNRLIRVRHSVAVTRNGDGTIIKGTKSEAGLRDVPIPEDLVPMIADHLLRFTQPGKDGLLFPAAHGGPMTSAAFRDQWQAAREAAGREDLRYHDLRHTALTLAAQSGATTAELMRLAGHSDLSSVARYQHATDARMAELAERMRKARGAEA